MGTRAPGFEIYMGSFVVTAVVLAFAHATPRRQFVFDDQFACGVCHEVHTHFVEYGEDVCGPFFFAPSRDP